MTGGDSLVGTHGDREKRARSREEVESYYGLYERYDKLLRSNRSYVKNKVKKGIPQQVQWLLWMKMARVDTRRKVQPGHYAELIKQDSKDVADADQIKKDIPRTFPLREDFTKISNYVQWQRRLDTEYRGFVIGDEFEQIKYVNYVSFKERAAHLYPVCSLYY